MPTKDTTGDNTTTNVRESGRQQKPTNKLQEIESGLMHGLQEEFLRYMRNKDLAGADENIGDMGEVTDYLLGINFSKAEENKIHLSQPHLIKQIVKEVGVGNAKVKKTPATCTQKILQQGF